MRFLPHVIVNVVTPGVRVGIELMGRMELMRGAAELRSGQIKK